MCRAPKFRRFLSVAVLLDLLAQAFRFRRACSVVDEFALARRVHSCDPLSGVERRKLVARVGTETLSFSFVGGILCCRGLSLGCFRTALTEGGVRVDRLFSLRLRRFLVRSVIGGFAFHLRGRGGGGVPRKVLTGPLGGGMSE